MGKVRTAHKLETGIEVVRDYDRSLPATVCWSPPDRFIARRWASFLGPLRGEIVEGGRLGGLRAGRRMRAQLKKTRMRCHSRIRTSVVLTASAS
jgi:hypothetical protein